MQRTEPVERLLTRVEVEEIFGISKRFLEVAAVRGDGPKHYAIGRSVRYRVSDINLWIDSRGVRPNSASRGF